MLPHLPLARLVSLTAEQLDACPIGAIFFYEGLPDYQIAHTDEDEWTYHTGEVDTTATLIAGLAECPRASVEPWILAAPSLTGALS